MTDQTPQHGGPPPGGPPNPGWDASRPSSPKPTRRLGLAGRVGIAIGTVFVIATIAGCSDSTADTAAVRRTSPPTVTTPPPTTEVATTAAPTTSPPTTRRPTPTTRKPAPTTRYRPPTTRKATPTTQAPARNCDSAYPDACLHDGIGDYDCAGGSGNGPNYVEGPIEVRSPDPFDLDRDGDGVGCER